MSTTSITDRLEYLRGQIRGERIAYSEIADLQDLADEIDLHDLELLQWAGVPEFHVEDGDDADTPCSEVKCLECRREETRK